MDIFDLLEAGCLMAGVAIQPRSVNVKSKAAHAQFMWSVKALDIVE